MLAAVSSYAEACCSVRDERPVLPLAISLVLCGVMFWLFMRAQTGGIGKVMNFGRSRARIHDPIKNKVTFADVAVVARRWRRGGRVGQIVPAGGAV